MEIIRGHQEGCHQEDWDGELESQSPKENTTKCLNWNTNSAMTLVAIKSPGYFI